MRGGLVSKEVADRFVEALRKPEEGRDVEVLVGLSALQQDVSKPLHERRT